MNRQKLRLVGLGLIVLVSFLSVDACATDLSQVGAGERVRVTYDTTMSRSRPFMEALQKDTILSRPAWFLWARNDTLAFAEGSIAGSPRYLSLSEVIRLDRSVSSHRHTLAGTIIGVVVGLGILSLLVALFDSDMWEGNADRNKCFVKGAAIGAFTGAIVGSLTRSDKWQEVQIRDLPTQGLQDNGSTTIGLRLGFKF
ncbi:MAG TPA: hypothetical protein PLF13_03300 [candidate division Zixibacteria bacterium]|nr:hypothetical protein [candidate division Zixibacteria bacterium]